MRFWWWKLKIHPTWQLTTALLGIVDGLGVSASNFGAVFSSLGWLMVGLVLVLASILRPYRLMLVIALAGGVLIGLYRGGVDHQQLAIFQPLYGHTIRIVGTVSEDPDFNKTNATLLRLVTLSSDGRELPGSIFVTIAEKNTIQRSDRVIIEGELQSGFGSFVGTMYQPKLIAVQRPEPGDVALKVRDNFADHVRLGISEPASSLGLGYLLGQRRALPNDLIDALKIAGLTHVIVASGYNLTILVRLIKRLFEKVSRFQTVFFSTLLVISFVLVTGLSPSMWRAGLVTLASLAAWYFGRKFHPLTLLALAAAVTGLINPSYVYGNLGWQLSFAAFGGVMILAPLLQAYFFGTKKPGFVRQVLVETVSAQIVTAPLILYAFGTISNVAVLSNLLILPLVPLAMLLTFITGVVGYLIPPLVVIVGLPAQWLLNYMVYIAEKTASLSWAQSEVQLSFAGASLIFVGIVAVCIYMWRATGLKLRDSNIVE